MDGSMVFSVLNVVIFLLEKAISHAAIAQSGIARTKDFIWLGATA